MKSLKIIVAGVAALVCATAMGQYATRGSGGWGAAAPYNALYNHNTYVEFEGKVIGIERSIPMAGMEESLAMLVKSKNGGTSTVDLGPAWYVDNLRTSVNVGDRVKVCGSKVFNKGNSMILAQKVTRNNNVMYLRAEDGFPMWVAWRGHVTVAANNTARNNAVISDDASFVDANGVVVLNGTVSDIIEIPVGQAGTPSVILVVGNNGNFWNVDLGPTWFINRQDMFFNRGDSVSVSGVVVDNNGRPIRGGGEVNGERRLIDPRIWGRQVDANGRPVRGGGEVNGERRLIDPRIWGRQVQRGGQTMNLRSASGVPIWQGFGGRR